MVNWKKHLIKMNPCPGGMSWLDRFSGTLAQAWLQCPSGAWLMWVAARSCVSRRLLVAAACEWMQPIIKIEPACKPVLREIELWTQGESTLDGVELKNEVFLKLPLVDVTVLDCMENLMDLIQHGEACYADTVIMAMGDFGIPMKSSARVVRRHITWRMICGKWEEDA